MLRPSRQVPRPPGFPDVLVAGKLETRPRLSGGPGVGVWAGAAGVARMGGQQHASHCRPRRSTTWRHARRIGAGLARGPVAPAWCGGTRHWLSQHLARAATVTVAEHVAWVSKHHGGEGGGDCWRYRSRRRRHGRRDGKGLGRPGAGRHPPGHAASRLAKWVRQRRSSPPRAPLEALAWGVSGGGCPCLPGHRDSRTSRLLVVAVHALGTRRTTRCGDPGGPALPVSRLTAAWLSRTWQR